MTVALMVIAGSIGALARYEVSTRVQRRSGAQRPLGIAIVNVSGALLLGLLAGYARGAGLPDAIFFGAFGFFGGYTTFSTWMVDSVLIAEEGRPGRRALLLNLAGQLAAGLAAMATGMLIGEFVLAG